MVSSKALSTIQTNFFHEKLMLGKSIFYKINLFVPKAKRLLASNRVCQQFLLSHHGIGFQLKPILLMTPSPCWKLTQKSILVLMVEVFGRHGIWSIIFISKILGQMIGSVIKCDLGSISSTLLCNALHVLAWKVSSSFTNKIAASN